MRCPQCGFEAAPGVAFCSRCGTRLTAPRPSTVREYALTRILPSWWHFARQLFLVVILAAGGLFALISRVGSTGLGVGLIAAAAVIFAFTNLARRAISWSLTSDRLIERRGLLSSRRREMELADVRSVEVDRRLLQRLLGLGDVAVASAASAEFLIRLYDIPDPERAAEILRQARLKRLV